MPKPHEFPDRLQQMFYLYVEASQRRDELLEECRRLIHADHRESAKRGLAAAC